MSERDDKLLAEHMAKLREDNEEISGDEDSEEEEDTGMGEIDVENAGSGITDWDSVESYLFTLKSTTNFKVLSCWGILPIYHATCVISIKRITY